MRWFLWLPALALVLGALTAPARGQAVPAPDFAVTPRAGEWMILAAHFSGPDAGELARQLVWQLRNQHRYAAYTFNRGEEARRRQQQEEETLRRLHPGIRIRRPLTPPPDECAVLIGDFRDLEAASAALERVKKLPLPDLKLSSGRLPYDYEFQTQQDPSRPTAGLQARGVPVNPLARSFVVHNPTIPRENQANGIDPLLGKFNADEEYSLLKCPRPWTLAVKDYLGTTVLQPQSAASNFLKMIGLSKPGETLSATGHQAHALAEFLHKNLGLETYVLHTRCGSVVTVGAFNGRDDPELKRMQQRLRSLSFRPQNGGPDPIQLFVPARPMEVPRVPGS